MNPALKNDFYSNVHKSILRQLKFVHAINRIIIERQASRMHFVSIPLIVVLKRKVDNAKILVRVRENGK